MRIFFLFLCYSNEMWPFEKTEVMQLWGGDGKKKDDVGAGRCSRATFTFEFRLWVFLFAIFSRLLRHQSSNQTALRLSRASVVSVRAGVWNLPQFYIKTKMVMNNSPRAVSLTVTKVVRWWWGGGWKGVLRASGKRISVHWLRVGALSPSCLSPPLWLGP